MLFLAGPGFKALLFPVLDRAELSCFESGLLRELRSLRAPPSGISGEDESRVLWDFLQTRFELRKGDVDGPLDSFLLELRFVADVDNDRFRIPGDQLAQFVRLHLPGTHGPS